MTTILIALLIIAIASAFVCGAEVQKVKLKQKIKYLQIELDAAYTVIQHYSKAIKQCESDLIKQTNEHHTPSPSTRVLRDEPKNNRPASCEPGKDNRCFTRRPGSGAGQGRVKVRQANG